MRTSAHQLYLAEFVQAVQAAHVLAIRACLAAEALGVGAVLDGEVFLVEDDVAVDVRHGHLGGGDEVEVVQLAVVHLALLVGQLACAVARSSVHHRGRHHFRVAGGACLVQEEVNQCALQSCALAFVDGEARAGDFHAQVEVDDVILLGQFPVGQGVLGQGCLHAAHLDYEVVFGAVAFGHFVVGYVGDGVEQLLQVLCGLVHLGLEGLVGFLQLGNARLCRFGLVLAALLHQLAYLLGGGVYFGQVRVELHLGGLPPVIERQYLQCFFSNPRITASVFSVICLMVSISIIVFKLIRRRKDTYFIHTLVKGFIKRGQKRLIFNPAVA